MYGVTKDLDLLRLHGVDLHMIWVSRYDVQFVFYDGTRVMAMHELVVRRNGADLAT